MDTIIGTLHKTPIDGLLQIPKRVIRDDRGAVFHMLRSDDSHFRGSFGEIYCSSVKNGIIKGWKKHHEMNQRFVVPVGEVEFIFYDDRVGSPTIGCTHRLTVSEQHYCLLIVPALLWYAFRGKAGYESLIINCASIPHQANETTTADYSQNPFPIHFTT